MQPIILTGPQNLTNLILNKVYKKIKTKRTLMINALGSQIMPDIFFKAKNLVNYDIIGFWNFSSRYLKQELFEAYTEKLFLVATDKSFEEVNFRNSKLLKVNDFSTFPDIEKHNIINYFVDLILLQINLAYLPMVVNSYDAKDIQIHYYNSIQEKLKFIDVTYECYSTEVVN